jgi:hypothetical protein
MSTANFSQSGTTRHSRGSLELVAGAETDQPAQLMG